MGGREWATDRSERRIESFWARARQSDVLPVPGGPWRRTTLEIWVLVSFVC